MKNKELISYIQQNIEQIKKGLAGLDANLIALVESLKPHEESLGLGPMKMIEEILNAREVDFGRVSNAEYSFVQGIAESLTKWGSLTPKQSEAIENTYRSIILGEDISYK